MVFKDLDRQICALVGMARNSNASNHRMSMHRRTDMGVETHIRGAMAEFATAFILQLNWRPIADGRDTAYGDVGGLQVKSIGNKNDRLCIPAHNLDDNFPYLLAYVTMERAELLAWVWGRDIRRDFKPEDFGQTSAFYVPQNYLRPMCECPYERPI